MEKSKSDSKMSAASEYALIFGAGASAAVSLAAQQVAAASLPVTALVAIGLLNRRRLDQKVKEGEPLEGAIEQQSHRVAAVAQGHVTSQPMPEAIAPQPHAMSPAMSRPALGFSNRLQSRQLDKEQRRANQEASLQAIGAHLQKIRQEQSLSLQDIHQRTYIQRYALQAIETGDLSTLPEPFYIRAFIEKYAIALGLPGSELAARFPAS
jgi:hypothetical protein